MSSSEESGPPPDEKTERRLATSKTLYNSSTRKNREDELVSGLSIPKTTSLYTKRDKTEGKKEAGPATANGGGLSPEPGEGGRKNSKAEIFRLANSLTLRQNVNADPVEFVDGSTGNRLRFSPSGSAGRGISYHVNGSPRPDICTIVYDARGPMLRFVDIFKGCHLPEDAATHPLILSKLKQLADETGVWNNITTEPTQRIVFTQTNMSDIVFCQSVSNPHRIKVMEPNSCFYVKSLYAKTLDSKTALVGCQNETEWVVVRDSHFDSKISKLRKLCDKLGVQHKFGNEVVCVNGKIWVTSDKRKCLRVVAVAAARNKKVNGLPRVLMREVTKWCGTSEPPVKKSNSLHILVVLWGYSDVVECRHVRCSQSSATPSHVHKKLSQDKTWQDARSPTATWNSQAVYWLGGSDISDHSFKPIALLPNVSLLSQGFHPGSGQALHIVSTKDTDRLATFRQSSAGSRRSSLSSDHLGKAASGGDHKKKKKKKHKDCTLM